MLSFPPVSHFFHLTYSFINSSDYHLIPLPLLPYLPPFLSFPSPLQHIPHPVSLFLPTFLIPFLVITLFLYKFSLLSSPPSPSSPPSLPFSTLSHSSSRFLIPPHTPHPLSFFPFHLSPSLPSSLAKHSRHSTHLSSHSTYSSR